MRGSSIVNPLKLSKVVTLQSYQQQFTLNKCGILCFWIWNWIFHVIHQTDKFPQHVNLALLRSTLCKCLKQMILWSSDLCRCLEYLLTIVSEFLIVTAPFVRIRIVSAKSDAIILNDISTQMWKPINHRKKRGIKD